MASYDPEVANSSGYFKDPITKEDLSPETPRVVQCELKDGKFIWPCVAASDGSQLLKIVYKYFTDEEKDLYKAYRGRPSSGEPKQRKPKEPKPVEKQKTEEVTLRSEPAKVVNYDTESATSLQTLTLLAQCNEFYGISFISGIAYALVGKRGENKVYHIPRRCIPDEEFYRIQGANNG